MERLYRKKARSGPGQKRRDSCWPDDRSRKRQRDASFCSQPTAGRSADMPSSRMGSEGADSDLGEPPQLQADVASFLQGSSKMTEEESEEISPEPPISQPAKWVQWKAKKCDVPEWWVELSTVLVEDIEKLARQERASFKLPNHMHELDPKEAPFHAPQLHHVSTDGGSWPPLYLPLFAGTSGKSLEKKRSHMPELCSTSWSRKTCHRRINHALWQKA